MSARNSRPTREIVRALLDGVANAHHWVHRRELTAMVSDDVLRRSPAEVQSAHKSDWRSLLELD